MEISAAIRVVRLNASAAGDGEFNSRRSAARFKMGLRIVRVNSAILAGFFKPSICELMAECQWVEGLPEDAVVVDARMDIERDEVILKISSSEWLPNPDGFLISEFHPIIALIVDDTEKKENK